MKNVEVSSVCSVYLLKLRPTSLTASLTELDLKLCEFTRTPGPNLSREFICFSVNGVASKPFRYSLIFSSKKFAFSLRL